MRYQFKIREAMLFVALVACGSSHIMMLRNLNRVKAALALANKELYRLDISGTDRLNAVARPSYDELIWRRVIQFPKKGHYGIRFYLGTIPSHGLPKSMLDFPDALFDRYHRHLPGEVPTNIRMALFRNSLGKWVFRIENDVRFVERELQDVPLWMDKDAGWVPYLYKAGETESCGRLEPLLLVKQRIDIGPPSRSPHYDTNPFNGVLIWLECIE